jgi:hypothetical protein
MKSGEAFGLAVVFAPLGFFFVKSVLARMFRFFRRRDLVNFFVTFGRKYAQENKTANS